MPQEPRQATAATQPYPDRRPVVPHEIDIVPEGLHARERRPRSSRRFGTSPCSRSRRPRAAPIGRRAPTIPESHLLYVCAHDGISAYSSNGETDFMTPQPGHRYSNGHVRTLRASACAASSRPSTDDQPARVAPAMGRDVLQRLDRDGRRARVRRPQRQPVHGARQGQRQPAVGVSTPTPASTRRRARSSTTANSTCRCSPPAASFPARSTATACGCSRSTRSSGRPLPARRATRPRPIRARATNYLQLRAAHGSAGTLGAGISPLSFMNCQRYSDATSSIAAESTR